jgi:hypothetical protein
VQDPCLDGLPIASIVDCRPQNIANLTTRPSRRLKTAASEIATTDGSEHSRIRSNELCDLNTQDLAQFVHLVRAGAPT